MRIIISPAKKMNVDTDSLPIQGLPRFLPKTEQRVRILQSMSEAELKKLWKCNDQIAALNIQRLQNMDLHNRLTPAVAGLRGHPVSVHGPRRVSQIRLLIIYRRIFVSCPDFTVC